MPDRKKVIKALECRKNADKRCGNPCEDTGLCHYATAVRGLDGEIYKPFICDRERICADALALLKEQEQKPGHWENDKYGNTLCSVCGGLAIVSMTGCLVDRHLASYLSDYCPHCGAKMDKGVKQDE